MPDRAPVRPNPDRGRAAADDRRGRAMARVLHRVDQAARKGETREVCGGGVCQGTGPAGGRAKEHRGRRHRRRGGCRQEDKDEVATNTTTKESGAGT